MKRTPKVQREDEFVLSLCCSDFCSLYGSPYRPEDPDAPAPDHIETPKMPIPGLTETGATPLYLMERLHSSREKEKLDPRLLFVDAPSLGKDPPVAESLRVFRTKALKGDVEVAFRQGPGTLTRTEEAILPDGTIYRMRSVWQPDPQPPVCLKALGSQT